jgi:hypothetical protein
VDLAASTPATAPHSQGPLPARRVVERLDDYQQRHRWVGLPLAVVYQFSDDQGTYLAVLITYYGFVSLFTLLLLLVTILGFALRGDPAGWPPGGLTRFPDDTRCRCLIGSVGRWVTSSMASLHQKKVNGGTSWYLQEMARVDGTPKMISERYLGTASDIAAAVASADAANRPERTRHLRFGERGRGVRK